MFGMKFISYAYLSIVYRIVMLAVLVTAPINIGYPWYEKIVASLAIVFVFPQPGGPLINDIFSSFTNSIALFWD